MKLTDGNVWIEETYLNATEGYRFGESGVYETFTNDTGALFRSLQGEYGRCVSKVYVDPESGGAPVPIGWVFVKRMAYEDSPREFYTREVWVTLHAPTETEIQVPRSVHPVLPLTSTARS